MRKKKNYQDVALNKEQLVQVLSTAVAIDDQIRMILCVLSESHSKAVQLASLSLALSVLQTERFPELQDVIKSVPKLLIKDFHNLRREWQTAQELAALEVSGRLQ